MRIAMLLGEGVGIPDVVVVNETRHIIVGLRLGLFCLFVTNDE